MRSPDEKRIKSPGLAHGSWSVAQGDYIKQSLPNEKTFKTFRKREKTKRFFLTLFLILCGYSALVFILSLLTKL